MTRSRLPIIILVIACLVGASAIRPLVGPPASQSNLSQLKGFTLGLILGGLRGPLVMVLWSSSESQKTARQLEDFETKVELIGRLQPEFDAVHIFQIWNIAYNISVQVVNLPGKYTKILDAIDYGRRVAAERPENINIETAIGGVYFDKLGNSAEKIYYVARMKEETQPREPSLRFCFPRDLRDRFIRTAFLSGADPERYRLRFNPADGIYTVTLRKDLGERVRATFAGPDVTVEELPLVIPSDRSTLRTSHDVLLDATGKLLPTFVSPNMPAEVDEDQWRPEDGELAYLRKFEPFPYGVSPTLVGYNYFKRSLALQISKNQVHAQLSERVTSSRPAVTLRHWADENWRRARRLELQLFGLPIPDSTDNSAMELPTAASRLDGIGPSPILDEIVFSLRRVDTAAREAAREYERHIARYGEDRQTYASHIGWVKAIALLCDADADYLSAAAATGEQRTALLRSALRKYVSAQDLFYRHALRFYLDDEVAARTFPEGLTRIDLDGDRFPADQIEPVFNRVAKFLTDSDLLYLFSDFAEMSQFASRARFRANVIQAALNPN